VSTVVYSSPFVPAEWIAAHGLRPLRLRPGAGAASVGPVMGMCPYARAFVGDVASAAAIVNPGRGGSPDPAGNAPAAGWHGHAPLRGHAPAESGTHGHATSRGHVTRPLASDPASGAAGRVADSPWRETRRAQGAGCPPGVVINAVVLTTTCDQMRRAAEWLALGGGPPVFLMNVPATWQTPASARLYRDELQRLGRFLVRLGGAAPSREHLADTMEAYDARRAALRGALGALGAREASEAIARFDAGEEADDAALRDLVRGGSPDPPRSGACEKDREHTYAAGQETRRARLEGPSVPREGPQTRRAQAVPLALVGGPLAREDVRVFDAIERAGGRVVLDGTESGARTFPAPFDRRRLRDDPLLELGDAYFGAIPDIFRRPDTALYQWLGRELAASAARGIVLWRNVWCDLWAAAGVRLREATGLPVLDLDVSGEEAGFNRTADRLQAFMEMLK